MEARSGSAERGKQAGQPVADDLGRVTAEVDRHRLPPGKKVGAKLPPPGCDRLIHRVHQNASPTEVVRTLTVGAIPSSSASRRRGATRSASV